MTTLYFGLPWGVPALDGALQVPTPTGKPCIVCRHSIADGDIGYARVLMSQIDILGVAEIAHVHAECELLGIIGHDFGVCTCTGYDTRSRAAALELWSRTPRRRS